MKTDMLPAADVAPFLKKTLFSALDPESVRNLIRLFERYTVQAGETVRMCGDERYAMYLVYSGRVTLRFPGNHTGFAELGSGDAFGIVSLLLKCESGVEAAASTDTDVFVFDAATLRMLEISNPMLALNILRCLRMELAPAAARLIPVMARLA